MDPIREAFQKIKQDMNTLYQEINFLRSELELTKSETLRIIEILEEFNEKLTKTGKNNEKQVSTHNPQNPTLSTHPSTHDLPLQALKSQNLALSTGNQGVPTDRQTDRQTDNKHPDFIKNTQNLIQNSQNYIDNAVKMLDSLDSIKKEIRLKFKRLTEQEILVFSTLYQLDEDPETPFVDYKTIAGKLGLTESSIRDYMGRLIKKGIPIEKTRVNNKQIHLSISKNLKKIASLPTILQLRDL